MSDEEFKEIEIDGDYPEEKKRIKCKKIGENEIIEKLPVDSANGVEQYSHRYKENGKWKPCNCCGDKYGLPSPGGLVPSMDIIENGCSKYRTY